MMKFVNSYQDCSLLCLPVEYYVKENQPHCTIYAENEHCQLLMSETVY